VDWPAIFSAFLACHLAGDFLFQTQWQAEHKRGGLGSDPVRRRALISHVLVYGLAFVPAFVWLASDLGATVVALAALIVVPHLIQDDGRLLKRYIASVKGAEVEPEGLVFISVDQSFHFIALFFTALLASSLS
jgi:hypothetical protein